MQLVFAIVQNEDADGLCQPLNKRGYRVTRINSGGGFLARSNVTVMLGVEDEQVGDVLQIIKANCHSRRSYLNPLPWGPETGHLALSAPAPLEVEIGGATIFTVPVRRFLRVRGGPAPPAVDTEYPLPADFEAGDKMDLVLSIVRAEDADQVATALLQAGFRLTRLPTAGAFLRRGNVTLASAVPRSAVDQVLVLIQNNCRFRAEAQRPKSMMPQFSATVFVVPLASYLHWMDDQALATS
jgi:uncharacterized protein YaaQ